VSYPAVAVETTNVVMMHETSSTEAVFSALVLFFLTQHIKAMLCFVE
jgi:hypothetical protein